MKGTKEQKGITLIALIITIVVLLILAAVAISSIQENGILGYATNAADAWNKAQTNEQAMLDSYLAYLDNLQYQQCPGHTYSSETGTCTNCGYPCQHDWVRTNEWFFSEPVICKVCGVECKHPESKNLYYSHFGNSTPSEHIYGGYCKTCDYPSFESNEYCTLVDGTCTLCGGGCEHGEGDWEWSGIEDYIEATSGVSNGDRTHKIVGKCKYCGIDNITTNYSEDCENDGSGNCIHCQYQIPTCTTHEWNMTDGGWAVGIPVICNICGVECKHTGAELWYGHTDGTEPPYHIGEAWCDICNNIVEDDSGDCTFVNGTCTKCGFKEE